MEWSRERPRPHALLLPYPAQGHINPMMQLGKRLAALGVRVTFANIQHIHVKILRAQQALAQPVTDCHGDFTLHGIRDGLPDDADRHARSPEMLHVIGETLQEGALELVHSLASQGCPVTFIIGDFFLRWTCALARRTALPEFVLWPQCASVFSIFLHVDSIVSSGYDPFQHNVRATSSREDFKGMISCIPGLPPIHPADLPFEAPHGKWLLEWLRELFRLRFRRTEEAQGFIINSFEALEEEVCEALKFEKKQQDNAEDNVPHIPSFRFLGPLVPSPWLSKEKEMAMEGKMRQEVMTGSSLWEEEVEECMQWLDQQPPASVVLVAFGSITLVSVDQLYELAAGLAASGQRFLWVIREDSIRLGTSETELQDAVAPAVKLEEALPHGFVEANKHTCKVVNWAPQALVLSHPSVGGFFSHCGWNSTLEGLCAGVPILGWPWLVDQVTNCWLVTHVWKTGLTLPRNLDSQASKEDIESCLKQLMEGPQAAEMRAKAREISKLAQEATIESTPLFQSFINDVQSWSASVK